MALTFDGMCRRDSLANVVAFSGERPPERSEEGRSSVCNALLDSPRLAFADAYFDESV